MDTPEVWPTTFTQLNIRPYQYTDEDGQTHIDIRVEVAVDCHVMGRGTGRTLGRALIAAGLDMVGIEADLLEMVLTQAKQQAGLDQSQVGTVRRF